MKTFILENCTYTQRGNKAVFEIAKRLGWEAKYNYSNDIVINYPEEDKDLFEMLYWEEENYSYIRENCEF